MKPKTGLLLIGIFFLFIFVLSLLPLTQAIVDWEAFYNQHQYPRYFNINPSRRNVITDLIGFIGLAIVSYYYCS